MPFACIFVPDFPVEAIVRSEPELRSHAVAVLEGNPPLEKVVAANEEARNEGIYPGMTKLQAELCDSVTLRDRSELQESAAHRALLDCAQSFSPRVEDVAPDTLLLDLSGLKKLFGSSPKIAREISHRASDMGLETNVAVASTLEAVLLAAHGFSGVTVVPEGKESETLGSLLVEVLFAGETDPENAKEFLETLQRWGIRKFRDLAVLPKVELSERFGQRGLELQKKTCGVSNRTLVPSDPPLVFQEAIELEYPLVLLEPLAFVLNRMLEQLCARLQARSLAAQELHLELTLENGFFCEPEPALAETEGMVSALKIETTKATKVHEGKPVVKPLSLGAPPLSRSLRQGRVFERSIHLPVPLLDPKTFLKLLQLDLKAHPPGAPVAKIILRIEPAKPRPAQNGLFIPSSPEAEKLELTLARISGVVGEGRVGSPELLDTHRREAFEIKHFMPSAQKNENGSTPKGSRPKDLVTAFRMFRPAVVVKVNHQNGSPSHISATKRKEILGEVLWAAGPWRSSGDWWEQDSWIRDEWDIALRGQTGIALYRLVHDLVEGNWVLEGEYD
jgi:protein ImuB